MVQIKKTDVAYYAVDIEGSSFIHFVLKNQEAPIKSVGLGDTFWMGHTKDLGNEFMIYEDSWEDFKHGSGDEGAKYYLTPDVIEMVDDVLNNHYSL